MNKHRVFVYGTLKRGIHNHHLLQSAEFIGNAYTLDTFKMYSVGFPVIHFSDQPDAKAVYGEVYDVDDKTLKALDRLENAGVMYDRKQVNVALETVEQEIIDAGVHIYVGNPDYWGSHAPKEWTDVNSHDELEWRP